MADKRYKIYETQKTARVNSKTATDSFFVNHEKFLKLRIQYWLKMWSEKPNKKT
jgi:hypothetical protein